MLCILLPPANEVWGKVIFSEACVKNSIHGGGGGGIPACIAGGIPACLAAIQGVVSHHALQVSRPTPKGEVEGSGLGGISRPTSRGKLRGLACGGGVSRPTLRGGLQAHTQGVSQHALRRVPPSRRLLLRAVRILLECILGLQMASVNSGRGLC